MDELLKEVMRLWAKNYLQRLQKLDMQIRHRMDEMDALKSSMGLSGIDYSKDAIQATASNAQESSIIRYLDLERSIKAKVIEMINLRHEIITQIHALDNTAHIDLLFKRYVEYKRLEEIALEMHFSYIWVKHLHGKALQDFESRHPKTPLPVIL